MNTDFVGQASSRLPVFAVNSGRNMNREDAKTGRAGYQRSLMGFANRLICMAVCIGQPERLGSEDIVAALVRN